MESIEGETRLLRQALRELVKQGRVTREGEGKRGSPYRYGVSFACSEDIAQTSKRETEKVSETPINTEPNLVPTPEQESFLAPENDPTQDTAIGGPKKEPEPGVPDTDSDVEYL